MSNKHLSTPKAKTSHASSSDSAQTVRALSTNTQPTVDSFDTDDDHSSQYENIVEQEETGSTFSDSKEYSDLTKCPITADNDFILNSLM